jgi:hypothetical protein
MAFISGNSTVVLSPDPIVPARAEKLPPPRSIGFRPFQNFQPPARTGGGNGSSVLNPGAIVLNPDDHGLRKFPSGLRTDKSVVSNFPPGLSKTPCFPRFSQFLAGTLRGGVQLSPCADPARQFSPRNTTRRNERR